MLNSLNNEPCFRESVTNSAKVNVFFYFQECTLLKPSDTSRGKSVGASSKKVGLTGLVRLKSSSDSTIKLTSVPALTSSSTTVKPTPNGLSLLGTYSGSDSE